MSEYVIMPKEDYVNACAAIRGKTGRFGAIKSGEMEELILGIETGGGSSEDVRYVTFMSEDGTVELGKKAVATGDDCADPIARGVFSTPTKANSAQYSYTFYGWATTPNGAADSNWNKAVTEDRTVYANFVSVVRYYTITYYDSDGVTVLKTESLAYGATPIYTPVSDDYVFDKWVPDAVPVTGNTSYTATWKTKPAFETTTWTEIKQIADTGTSDTIFAVGDTRTDTITYADGTTEEITWIIANINGNYQDSMSFLSGTFVDGVTAHLAIVASHALPTKRIMRSSYSGDFENSDLAIFLNGDFFNALPEELRGAIKEVKVGYSAITNKVLIPHAKEIGNSSGGGKTFGVFSLFTSDATRVRKLGRNGSPTTYWLRNNANSGSYTKYATVNENGVVQGESTYINDSTQHGVVPMFFL